MFDTTGASTEQFPAVFESAGGPSGLDFLISEVSDRRELLAGQLLRSGALLLRGFGLSDVESFETFVRSFSRKEFFGYAGGVSPRVGLGRGIYTSTEYPQEMVLGLHNELSYSASYPGNLFFFCVVEPQIGGETTLGDSRRILNRVDAEIVDEFKRKWIRYERNLSPNKGDGYSWQDAFETDDQDRVGEICGAKGMSFEWRDDGYLALSETCPATAKHPATGEEVWFNQAAGFHPSTLDRDTYEYFSTRGLPFRLNATFGDGTEIPIEMLDSIRTILHGETLPHRWMQGDILIVDNLLTAHGRLPFSGPRKIVLAMT